MNNLSTIINKIKYPKNFNEFELNIKKLIEFYYKNEPREITVNPDEDDEEKLSEEELNRLMKELSDPDSIKDDGMNLNEKYKPKGLQFTIYTINLKDKSYHKNKEVIEEYINLLLKGANLYKASFDLADHIVLLEMVDYIRRTIWLVSFSVETEGECKLVKQVLIDVRARRRKNMISLITYKDENEHIIDKVDIKNLENVGVEYKFSRPIFKIFFKHIDDWLHFSSIKLSTSFYVKALAVEAHVGAVKYDKSEGAFYIIYFNYFYDLHIEEIKLPVISDEEVKMLEGIIKNLDQMRDSNLYYIQRKKHPDILDESSSMDLDEYHAIHGFKLFTD